MPFSAETFFPLLGRGDFADLYLEESRHLTLRWEDGRLDEVVQGAGSGAGLRYWRGEETLYGHIDCAAPVSDGLRSAERRRLEVLASDLAGRARARRAPRPAASGPRTHPVKVGPEALSLEEKVRLLERAEKAARAVPGVRQVTVTLGQREKKIGYANGLGQSFREDRTYLVFAVQVTAAAGSLLQTGYDLLCGGVPEMVPVMAARRAAAKLKAPSAPLGEMPAVIAAQAGGTLIHEAIGHALEADTIQQGASPFFAGKVGKVVANEIITVLDDPTRPGHRGSFHFDDEGVPSERTVLVENGVLKTYLYDRRSAKRDERPPNGHGRRESYQHKPIPRMSNTSIAPGKDSPEEIVRSLDKGLLVTRMGGGQVNPATGDFVFEVEEGFWVERGRVKNMVRGANLLGQGAAVLRTIDRVADDIGWSIGTCGKDGQGVPVSDGVPTLRIPKILIGGTQNK
jgi:TldD protein